MAAWHVQQLKFAFGLGGFMSFYGGLSLAIYFLSQYAGITIQFRFAMIALLLLTMPFALVIGYFVNRKKKKKEAAEEEGDGESSDGSAEEVSSDSKSEKSAKPSGNYEDFDKGAEEVVKFLKESNLGTTGDALYSLPWYLVTGATKSGKSSLVLGSDLDFQNLPSQRQSEQQLIRPTRGIDWRVTSDAVFVDTPGRFQSENSDGDEWTSLLETIKKNRKDRPLDGLILSVNTEKILHSDERDIEELAKAIRTRLDDATNSLKAKFPVYLVFTHADAIEGFRDSFSVSKKEGENLVWGSTIPLENSDNAQALFDSEYEILQDSIMKRRLIRLSAPFSPTRQLRIFNFPLHFGSARRKLGTFVTTLFRPNPFSESPFLRGFYFTAVPVNRKSRRRGKAAATPQIVGETFFTKRFFRDVVLRDKDLVKTFQAQGQKAPVLGWLLTIMGAFLTLVLLGFTAYSLYLNYKFVEDATDKGRTVLAVTQKDANRNPLDKPVGETQEELDAIENLRKVLIELDKNEREGAPWTMRFGMYSGDKIYKDKLLNIYYAAVQRRFRKPTIRKLEAELRAFANKPESSDPTNLTPEQEEILGKHYNLLAAYLMLSEEHKERSEPTILADTLKEYWLSESKLPPGNSVAAEAQLSFYFKQIDRDKENSSESSAFPRFTPDDDIVKKTRGKLKVYPAYLRYLRRKITEVSKEIQPETVETLLDGRGQGVISGTHEIPGAFTIEGYRRFMKAAIANANEELRKEDWVMGRTDEDAQAKEDELTKLSERYFNLYIDNWRELIRKTSVIEYTKVEDMKKSLRAFSDAESPMKILLLRVADNTKFSSKTASAKGWTDFSWVSDWWNGKGASTKDEPSNPVENEFDSLFTFLGRDKEEGKDGGKALIDEKYGKIIEKLNQTFGKIQASEKEKISIAIEKKDKESDEYETLDRSENAVDGLVKAFKSNAEEDIAILLKEPIVQIRGYFGVTAFKQLKDDWTNRMLPKARLIENGYPFTETGEADLTKLSAFLNPVKGELSEFYKTRLKDYFDEVNGKLVVKESSKYKFSPAFVAYLNNAFKLREVLYGKGNLSPSFKYDFRLLKVNNAIIEITIDGTKVTSEETGSKTIGFPAPQGASSGVLMRFSSTEDSSSTSGTELPPTSGSNSNSNTNTTSPTPTPGLSNYFQDSTEEKKTFQGTWGLFKFVESGAPTKDGEEYKLTYKLGSKTVKATLKPQGGDLFDKSIFRNVKAPDTILLDSN